MKMYLYSPRKHSFHPACGENVTHANLYGERKGGTGEAYE